MDAYTRRPICLVGVSLARTIGERPQVPTKTQEEVSSWETQSYSRIGVHGTVRLLSEPASTATRTRPLGRGAPWSAPRIPQRQNKGFLQQRQPQENTFWATRRIPRTIHALVHRVEVTRIYP